ncbi:MAG: YkgJ family cysteine cluster protein [bacterium]|nr:MAG: YkgJ family cysteine cluster protein [bacterium]
MKTSSDSICAGCARAGKSCCVNRQIYLTPGDVERITRATGAGAFVTEEAPWPQYREDGGDDPVWSINVLNGERRRTLARRQDGSCVFLGDRGCLLDLQVRPLLCRLHPYEYAECGLEGLDATCPVAVCGDPAGVLREMGMAPEAVSAWHRTLYEEIRTGGRRQR